MHMPVACLPANLCCGAISCPVSQFNYKLRPSGGHRWDLCKEYGLSIRIGNVSSGAEPKGLELEQELEQEWPPGVGPKADITMQLHLAPRDPSLFWCTTQFGQPIGGVDDARS